MRSLLILCVAASLSGCVIDSQNPPPAGRFYFPTGIVHVPSTADEDGTLYVASSNFDKRYSHGTVTSLKLNALRSAATPLPALGAAAALTQLDDLSSAIVDSVEIQNFAGEMRAYALSNGSTRLFIPARDEGGLFHVIDAAPDGTMTCYQDPTMKDCRVNALSLQDWNTSAKQTVKPRAPEPSGVALSSTGEVFVTHIQPADSPVGSRENFESYLVRLDGNNPSVGEGSFTSIGQGDSTGGYAVAVGQRYAYVTGRFGAPSVRMVDRQVGGRVLTTSIEGSPFVADSFNVLEGRGIALSSDERRVYLVARYPDSLVVMDVDDAAGDFPRLRVVNAVTLPQGPNELAVIERAGRGALVLITCTAAGVVVVFDEDLGALAAQVPSVGSQPFGLAVDRRANAARVYVSNFGDGNIAVVDLPDLNQPYRAQTVAKLGKPQLCLVRETDRSCREAQ
ncbi:MAG: YncE family protein [Myxococcaceae bacterium]